MSAPVGNSVSSFTFARVDPETLTVTLTYNTNGGAKWAEGDLECVIPFDVLADQAVLIDGQVTLVEDPAKVEAKRQAQIESNRAQRNSLLAQSDFAVLSDVPLANKPDWVSYRAALRAVDLSEPVWPTQPPVVWEG